MRITDPRRGTCRAFTLVAVVALVACGEAVPPPEGGGEEPDAVLAAYVLLAWPAAAGEPSQAVARVVLDGADLDCSSLTATGDGDWHRRHNPDPSRFPVTVCEALLPPGHALLVGGKSLPAVSLDPGSLVVLGDTGCKSKECPQGAASPFASLASQAASLSPDLVLHVGDYNYRGTSHHVPLKSPPPKKLDVYDAGDDAASDEECQLTSPYISQNAGYSANPDVWENWWLDLFEPAAPLFAAAPFVFARGNHELCSRAGPGWFYFLDPAGPATGTDQISCPDQGGDTPPRPPATADGHYLVRPAYTVVLETLNVGVLDSANACDAFAPFADCDTGRTSPVCSAVRDLSSLFDAMPAGKRSWLLSHRPFWGAKSPDGGACSDESWATINASLQASLSEAAPLPSGFELAVAGHMHRFQTLTFAGSERRPPQLVVGDGGVELDDPPAHLDTNACSFDTTVGGQPASGLEIFEFGFLHVTVLDGGGWSGELIGKAPTGGFTTLACCDGGNPPASVCSLGACA